MFADECFATGGLVFGRVAGGDFLPDYVGAAQHRGGLGENVFEGYFLICGPVEDLGKGILGELSSSGYELDVGDMFLEGRDDAGVDVSVFIVDYCIILVCHLLLLLASIYPFEGSLSRVVCICIRH